jgi:tol-pal system protein YbgF
MDQYNNRYNNNRFFYISFSLVFLFFMLLAFGCSSRYELYEDAVNHPYKSDAVSESVRKEYSAALSLFHKKKYGESITKFQKIYSDHSPFKLSPNCIYWIGECYYGLKDYKQAIVSFQRVLSDYPGSIKDDDALLMMGHSYFRLNNRTKTQEAYTTLQNKHPDSYYIRKIPPAFRK